MACIEISISPLAELMQTITECIIAAVGDTLRAVELFAEIAEAKGAGWLSSIVFTRIVKDDEPWHGDITLSS